MARKLIKKWNPKYSKTTVRLAIQDVLSKRAYGDISREDKLFVNDLLAECDRRYIEKNPINDKVN